jgi:hypothetical protein
MFRPGRKMRSIIYGHDRRMRLCGRCHSWYVSEGSYSPYCAACQAEARSTPELPWTARPEPPGFYDGGAMATGKAAIGERAA